MGASRILVWDTSMMDQQSTNSRGEGLHATETGITAGLVFDFKQMKDLLSKETMVPCQWGQGAITQNVRFSIFLQTLLNLYYRWLSYLPTYRKNNATQAKK